MKIMQEILMEKCLVVETIKSFKIIQALKRDKMTMASLKEVILIIDLIQSTIIHNKRDLKR